MHGDLVEYRLLRRRGPHGRPLAQVVAVVERQPRRLAGILHRRGERIDLEPIQRRFPRSILVGGPGELRSGDRAVAILEGGRAPGAPVYRFQEQLGDPSDPRSDAIDVAHEKGLPIRFSPAALAEGESSAKEPIVLGDRADLRHLDAITIDPEEAADFDDAVSWRPLPNGRDEVGVHIADVSDYVPESGAVDQEARERGTSVYLPGLVLPMVPPALSSEAASLKPEVERRAFSVVAVLDARGQVERFTIGQSLIRSRRRLTYAEAARILAGEPFTSAEGKPGSKPGSKPGNKPGSKPGSKPEEEPSWVKSLRRLGEIAAVLRERREVRGGLYLDVPEYRVHMDELGRPLDLIPRHQGVAHRLVEELMLLANELTGGWAKQASLPILYRIHARPRWEKLLEFGLVLDELGLGHRGRNLSDPAVLRQVVSEAEERGWGELVSTYLLRSLEKARYSPSDHGHYGLGVEAYNHFTSPIRRYPDLYNHRVFAQAVGVLGGGDPAARARRDAERLLRTVRDRYRAGLEELGEHTSAREVAAQDAERLVVKVKALRLLLPRLGEEMDGTVSATLGAGLFVALDNLPVDGFVERERLPADRYDLGPRGHSLAGRRRGTRFSLGQRVRVRIERISLVHRELDLSLVGGALAAKPKEGRP